jgi:DNA (cytosine-5)-methyltransferase 1
MKILNLYACLGGNRYKWNEVKEDIEVTAVELDPDLARMYQERFPNDKVIVADAHEYLLNNFKDFDFIWSSPPCPTHSKVRVSQKNRKEFDFKFPDMKLYEEIIFLDNFFVGKWCVENVIPYYKPLIQAQKRGRHLYWTNFRLPNSLNERKQPKDFIMTGSKPNENFHEIDLTNYKGKQRKDKIARNLVDYEAGKTIFATACGIIEQKKTEQGKLF